MQIKKKTIKQIVNTYDITDLSEEQYQRLEKALRGTAQSRATATRRRNARPNSTVKAAGKKTTTKQSSSPSAKPTPKSAIVPPAKPHRKPVTLKCPIGGETIKAQGAWNHVMKHGKENGMTEEQAKAAYQQVKEG